jgi:hypothetical protein
MAKRISNTTAENCAAMPMVIVARGDGWARPGDAYARGPSVQGFVDCLICLGERALGEGFKSRQLCVSVQLDPWHICSSLMPVGGREP